MPDSPSEGDSSDNEERHAWQRRRASRAPNKDDWAAHQCPGALWQELVDTSKLCKGRQCQFGPDFEWIRFTCRNLASIDLEWIRSMELPGYLNGQSQKTLVGCDGRQTYPDDDGTFMMWHKIKLQSLVKGGLYEGTMFSSHHDLGGIFDDGFLRYQLLHADYGWGVALYATAPFHLFRDGLDDEENCLLQVRVMPWVVPMRDHNLELEEGVYMFPSDQGDEKVNGRCWYIEITALWVLSKHVPAFVELHSYVSSHPGAAVWV